MITKLDDGSIKYEEMVEKTITGSTTEAVWALAIPDAQVLVSGEALVQAFKVTGSATQGAVGKKYFVAERFTAGSASIQAVSTVAQAIGSGLQTFAWALNTNTVELQVTTGATGTHRVSAKVTVLFRQI